LDPAVRRPGRVGLFRYKTQYAAVATDLATGREVWLQSGPIHEAVRASIALPGILSPARIDGRWLVDGGEKPSTPTTHVPTRW